MRKYFIIMLLLVMQSLFGIEPRFMYDPAISPSGEEVCFVYLDRLWSVDFAGGAARSLTSVDKNISSPQYSPGGNLIAYMTSREGYQSIYMLPSDGGIAEAVSKDDFVLCDWYPDGRSLLVTRYQERYRNEYFRLYLDGSYEKIASYSGIFSNLNRSGDKILFSHRGYPYREKYSGSANGDLWIYDIKQAVYHRLTDTDYTERYAQFSYQGDRIYFGASDGEVFQLYQVDDFDFGTKKKLTNFKEWSLRDLDIAHDNDRIVFEYFDQIWKYDPGVKKAEKLEIMIKEDIIGSLVQEEKYANSGDKFDVSSDGKLLVFSWKFDLFAMPVKGGDVRQITYDQKGIEDIAIMGDNKTIFFTRLVKGAPRLHKFDIRNHNEIEEVKWGRDKYIEYMANQGGRLVLSFSTEDSRQPSIAVSDSSGNKFRILPLAKGAGYGALDESGRYYLYSETDYSIWNRELKIFDLESENSWTIEKTTSWISTPVWGKDGKSAFYSKAGAIYRLDLHPKHEYFYEEEDGWQEILREDKKLSKAKKKGDEPADEAEGDPVAGEGFTIEFAGLHLRSESIVTEKGYNYVVHLTEDMVYYINNFEEQTTLRKVKYNGEDDEVIVNLGADIKNLSNRDKKWYYNNRNSIYSMSLEGTKPEKIENKFTYKYNLHQLNMDIFDQVWLRFGRGFYDPDMHGINWEKLYRKYSPYLRHAYQPEMLGNIIDEMIGEINASHTGFYARRDNGQRVVRKAELGVTFDFSEYPDKGVRFQKLYRSSSLAKNHNIKPGDILLSVDGVGVGKNLPFDQLFRDKTGEKIKLEINVGDSVRILEVKGINSGENYNLWYEDWVETRRAQVDALSGGRIAYSHIRGMDHRSYQKFEDELFGINFSKEALIIDVRFNGGGNTHDDILEVLTKKQYGWSSSRYSDAVPYPTPRNIWGKPIVLLIDEDSYSDAEIFPILFKHLKLGKVIGMPTSGSVIGTGHINFMDGSSMRMPSSGWWETDHTNMEGSGAQPDILVPMTPEDYITDNDVQLKRAIEELFKEIKD
jgi:tricorn protease